jgi:hypothetical protein
MRGARSDRGRRTGWVLHNLRFEPHDDMVAVRKSGEFESIEFVKIVGTARR